MAHDEPGSRPTATRPMRDAAVAATTDELELELELEDGIRVVRVNWRPWCASGGKVDEFCGQDEARCREYWGPSCTRRDSWACFYFRDRASGKDGTGCWGTYERCKAKSDVIAAHPELGELVECAIYRYDPKAKKP